MRCRQQERNSGSDTSHVSDLGHARSVWLKPNKRREQSDVGEGQSGRYEYFGFFLGVRRGYGIFLSRRM